MYVNERPLSYAEKQIPLVPNIKHWTPETTKGFVKSCRDKNEKYFCTRCKKLFLVESCEKIVEHEEMVFYAVTLECGCTRTIERAVKRTPLLKQEFLEQQERRKQSEKLNVPD